MLDSSSFAYDRQVPLALTIISERVQDTAIIQDITYASPRGGKVSAYLIAPINQPLQAGLIFGHWGQGDREEFVDEAIVLTRLGLVSLCIDAPYRRSAAYEPQLEEPPQAELQWIVDICRGVDLLLERFQLVPELLGYVGHSYAATFGGPLAGIEHRIQAYVLMAGYYSITEVMRTSTKPAIAQDHDSTPPEEFAAYLAALDPLDASHFIGHASPSSLFFQFARVDDFVSVEEGQCYFDLASEPKHIAWYDDCNHELSAQARLDRVTWLCEQLKLPPPSPATLDLLLLIPPPVVLAN